VTPPPGCAAPRRRDRVAHGGAVIGVAEHRSCRKQLVERERAVEDSPPMRPKSRSRSSGDRILRARMLFLEIRGVPVDCFDDRICRGFPLLVPARAPGQRRVEMLAERARHVLSGRGETWGRSARDQHLDDGLRENPAVRASK